MGSNRLPKLENLDLQLKPDISKLTEWPMGLHELPSISEFMKDLGGCTQGGKLYWRLVEQQIVSIILKGWSGDEFPITIKNKMCILMGSPGVGKSIMLCLLVFYIVFEQKKNVILYRKLMKAGQSNCLVYLGYENDQVKYFALPDCEVSQAKEIYKALKLKQEVWLMLDGFVYKDIPEGLQTFRLLATSQHVFLKSQERDNAYCLLHPCWELKDLKCLGVQLNNWEEAHVTERFYYSGGNVREFLRPEVKELQFAILDTISIVENALALMMSNSATIWSGIAEVDRLRRTFIRDPSIELNFFDRSAWERLIDSEYAILSLSGQLKPDFLCQIFNWARAAGHASLAESVFELYLHQLAADNRLELYVSEYALPEAIMPDCPRHLNVKQLPLLYGSAKCTGTARHYEADLAEWRDDDKFVYWFPACHDFPNIDSIVKLKLDSGKTQVAYLQITTAKTHSFDEKQLQIMNKIFLQEQANPPIYVVVCPDLESCKSIVLDPRNEVAAAMQANVPLYAGYYKMDSYISADGPIPLMKVPAPTYQMRKRSCSD